MENAMDLHAQNQGLFDNNKLFDAAGHLTDEGLLALQNGTLDELGRLETAEHLTFCDYCLARYTALLDAMQQALQNPMHDLVPQVQALMRLRSFRIMTNRYVSVAAAVALAITLWSFGLFGGQPGIGAAKQNLPTAQPAARPGISQMLTGAFDAIGSGVDNLLQNMQASAQSGLEQLADPVKTIKNNNKTAHGE